MTLLEDDVVDEEVVRASDLRSRRLVGPVVTAIVVTAISVGLVGGWLRATDSPSKPSQTVVGASVEARMVDLASSCVRNWANADPNGADAWRARLVPCYPLLTAMPDGLTPPPASQAAAEPQATVVVRTYDGLTATIVVRLRVSGDPEPVFGFYAVDVGCRPNGGACSLTTAPVPVRDVEGTR